MNSTDPLIKTSTPIIYFLYSTSISGTDSEHTFSECSKIT